MSSYNRNISLAKKSSNFHSSHITMPYKALTIFKVEKKIVLKKYQINFASKMANKVQV